MQYRTLRHEGSGACGGVLDMDGTDVGGMEWDGMGWGGMGWDGMGCGIIHAGDI